jgi:hypothetical protein
MVIQETIATMAGLLKNALSRWIASGGPKLLTFNPNLSMYSIGKFSYGVQNAPGILADPLNPQATSGQNY